MLLAVAAAHSSHRLYWATWPLMFWWMMTDAGFFLHLSQSTIANLLAGIVSFYFYDYTPSLISHQVGWLLIHKKFTFLREFDEVESAAQRT